MELLQNKKITKQFLNITNCLSTWIRCFWRTWTSVKQSCSRMTTAFNRKSLRIYGTYLSAILCSPSGSHKLLIFLKYILLPVQTYDLILVVINTVWMKLVYRSSDSCINCTTIKSRVADFLVYKARSAICTSSPSVSCSRFLNSLYYFLDESKVKFNCKTVISTARFVTNIDKGTKLDLGQISNLNSIFKSWITTTCCALSAIASSKIHFQLIVIEERFQLLERSSCTEYYLRA